MANQDHTTSTESALPHRFPKRDLTGQRFGRLLVLGFAEYRKSYAFWECLCDCSTICLVQGTSITRDITQSCGCYQVEQARKAQITHGQSKTLFYARWRAMLQRCINPNNNAYKNYGGRGITVCERWKTFTNFATDMGEPPPGMSIERRDNNGPYSKANCYWGTMEQQANNTRLNRLLTHEGKTQPLPVWAREKNIHPATIRSRLKAGLSVADALTKPLRDYTQTITRIARMRGMPPGTVQRRIKAGLSIEEALTMPLIKGRRLKKRG